MTKTENNLMKLWSGRRAVPRAQSPGRRAADRAQASASLLLVDGFARLNDLLELQLAQLRMYETFTR